MDNKNNNENINEETPKVITPGTENVVNSPKEDNKPQVVEVSNTNEVEQKVVDNNNQNNDTTVPTSVQIEENTTGTKKKGHPIFLTLLIIFLFAFVYFLPNITEYVTNYMNQKNGTNELKSGTMTCTFNNSTDNLNYTYDFSFKYEKNRLKSSRMTTTNRLADTATDNSILTERENSCEFLKTVLDENDIGMTADCSVSAAVQITTQNIDYEKLDMDFITNNITEFEGFYPEYELNQSVTTIEQELENGGYTCERNEYNDTSE